MDLRNVWLVTARRFVGRRCRVAGTTARTVRYLDPRRQDRRRDRQSLVQGDVAIRGDRIEAVGSLANKILRTASSMRRGLIVAPGFIDMHSHSDMTLLEDGSAQSKIRQGVTTEILGEDTSAGPAKGKRPPRSLSTAARRSRWTTLGGYFDTLKRQGVAVNVASYVGFGHAAGMRTG